MVLPFRLCNTTETIDHPVVQRTPPAPMNNEFVGMILYVTESFHNLVTRESESPSSSDSNRGSHHPSHECFMLGTPEGHVESICEEEASLTNDINDEVEGDTGAPPHLRVEQLKAQHQELKEA